MQGPEDDYRINDLNLRVDLARGAAYRLFAAVRSEKFFYFEAVLNVFISLVQEPLNFAVFKRDSGEWKPVFHFCMDKKHRADFERDIRKTECVDETKLFSLFSHSLGDDYRIAIAWMHTKFPTGNRKWTFIEHSENAYADDKERFKEVSLLSRKFFTERWPVFDSNFSDIIRQGLLSSLEALERRYFEVKSRSLNQTQRQISLGSSEIGNLLDGEVGTSVAEKLGWHHEVRNVVVPAIRSTNFGSTAYSAMAHMGSDCSKTDASQLPAAVTSSTTKIKPLQNLLLFYRSFDRAVHPTQSLQSIGPSGRHSDDSGSYQYNVQLMLDNLDTQQDSPTKTIPDFFKELKQIRESETYTLGSSKKIGKFPRYRDLLPLEPAPEEKDPEAPIRAMIAHSFDHLFWEMLRSDSGIKELLEVISSPVGDLSRSIADPVFHTGLIHLNPLFRGGGLDRVKLDLISIKKREELLSLHHRFSSSQGLDIDCLDEFTRKIRELESSTQSGIYTDLLRIVIVFYVMSEMASSQMSEYEDQIKKNENLDLSAILLPVKIRGAVWAVSIHATYLPSQSPEISNAKTDTFLRWLSRFNLMTAELDNITGVIDRSLWENSQRKITKLLAEKIGFGGDATLAQRLNLANDSLRDEQRLVPFVLPEFYTNTSLVHCPEYHVSLLASDRSGELERLGRALQLCWKLEENHFFVGHQPWPSAGSVRSLEAAVELGQLLGFRNWSQSVRPAKRDMQ